MDDVPAGEYEIYGYASGYSSGNMRIYLYNLTSAARVTKLYSISSNMYYDRNVKCMYAGRFTLSEASSIELRYQVSSSHSTNGLGDASNLGSIAEYFGAFELRQIEAY